MRPFGILLLAVILAVVVLESNAEEKKKVKKLQIGVKKRVKDCTRRSTKGDSLEMHYTVSISLCVANLYLFFVHDLFVQ